MSFTFGKSVLCDQSNLSASRAYINNALLVRGMLRDEQSQLKFNSADAPAVINLLYDFLKKSEQDDEARESMSARVREISLENDRLMSNEVSRIVVRKTAADACRNASRARSSLSSARLES